MSKRSLVIIWTMAIAVTVNAHGPDSTARVSEATFDLFPVFNPWLGTSNPAGLRFNPGVDISDLTLNYEGINQDYRRPQEGDSLRNYYLETSSYKRIQNTMLYGSFMYEKSYERNCNFNLVNDPYRHTPYLLLDTLGRNDLYDREYFNMRGDLSTPVASHFSYGLSVNMDVGLSSQDRDPRPRNKVMNLDVAQGLLFTTPVVSLGVNMLYSYYNEDIEADIIQENVQHAFFQLHGFDTYTSHVAASFYRLYERTTYGGEGQLALHTGGLHSVFGTKFLYMTETADDGRKAGDASWSYIKNDSELQGTLLSIFNTSTFSHGRFHHHLDAGYTIRYMLGAEFLQRLEQVGDAGAVDWVDYGREEKYGATYSDLDLGYTFLLMKDRYLPGLEVKLGLAFEETDQLYKLPDMNASYRNRNLSGSAVKTFYAGRHELKIGAGVYFRKNLASTQDLARENFITTLLVVPDFIYNTQNTSGKWLSAAWSVDLDRLFRKYFASLYLGAVNAEDGTARQQIKLKTGLIF